MAVPERMDSEEVEEFCNGAGYDWELVPDGALAVPPESNVEDTDWKEEGTQPPESNAEIADAELERIRRQFEGLL